jgi:hypothetical protein
MELKKLYSWSSQPNGKYAIFDIPVFKLFKDDEKGELKKEDALEIIRNFQADVEKNGYYPRVHIEHQTKEGSRPGAGFLDNLRFDGKEFLADIVEIPSEVFHKIKKMELPYRSVEYHQEKKKILSLALLESTPSYFQFPLLALQEKGNEMDQEQKVNFSMRQKAILKFSSKEKFCGCKEKMIMDKDKDKEEENKIDDEEEIEQMQADETGGEETPEPMGDGDYEEGPEHEEEEFDKLDILVENTNKILSFLRMLLGEEEGGTPGEGEATQPGPEDVGQAPPVAMQMFSELSDRISMLENRQSSSRIMNRLKSICSQNPTINFSQEAKIIKRFSNDSDRATYLDALESKPSYSKHPATKMLESVRTKEISKFSQGIPELEKTAKDAIRDYQDTINQPDRDKAKKFQATWPKVEKWIEHKIDEKKIELGMY